MIEVTYLTPDEKGVQHVSEGSMAVLQIATLSSGSAILFFHSQESTKKGQMLQRKVMCRDHLTDE